MRKRRKKKEKTGEKKRKKEGKMHEEGGIGILMQERCRRERSTHQET